MLWSMPWSLFFRLCCVTILGFVNQTNMHFTSSIFNMTEREVSSQTKSMMRNNFEIGFSPISCAIFEIRTLTPNLAFGWRCKLFPCVTFHDFTIPRLLFYDCSFCRSEIIGVTTDFSGQTLVYILLKWIKCKPYFFRRFFLKHC